MKDTGDGPIEPTLARKFSRAFAAFARTGDPSAEGFVWPQYDAKQRKILQPHFMDYWRNRVE